MPTKNPPKRVEKLKHSHAKEKQEKLEQWIAENAKPKKIHCMPEKPEPTRFQKPGPMTVTDWMRFHKWLSKTLPKKKRPSTEAPPKKKPVSGLKKKIMAGRAERVNKLAKPKSCRCKYEPPPQENGPFRPHIDLSKPPPQKEKYRPFDPIKLPYWWYHEELEAKFWREMRFPISRRALRYTATCTMLDLCDPKPYPPPPHCPIPEKVEEEIPPRKKMTPKQWKEHKRRLEYLSDPRHREISIQKVKDKLKAEEEIMKLTAKLRKTGNGKEVNAVTSIKEAIAMLEAEKDMAACM